MIPRYAGKAPVLSQIVQYSQWRYKNATGRELSFSRAFWTPPLTPREAIDLEGGQIERSLGMKPLISITDHDDIHAAEALRVADPSVAHPISFEWSIPYGPTFFHLGVHNLPPSRAHAIAEELFRYTASPDPDRLPDMFDMLNRNPDTLLILNHPLWDEAGLGAADHRIWLNSFLDRHVDDIHALELNGLRPWIENQDVVRLVGEVNLPVISGGDRHGREPNANLNLTNAATFSEFAAEVREDKRSEVLFMPQYREPIRLRRFQTAWDILREYPDTAPDRVRWTGRVFYETEAGEIRPLSYWSPDDPLILKPLFKLMWLLENRRLRPAMRMALTGAQEARL